MRLVKVRILAAMLLAVLAWWWLWPHAIAAPMLVYAGSDAQPVVIVVKPKADMPPLGDEAMRALAVDLPQTRYFGAFAVGPEARFGWVGNRHGIENARAGALSRCGTGCEIALELYPAGYEAAGSGRPVSVKLADKIAARSDLGPDSAVYYALAPNGSWALQKVGETGLLAPLQVLNRCRSFLRGVALLEGCTLFHGAILKAPPP